MYKLMRREGNDEEVSTGSVHSMLHVAVCRYHSSHMSKISAPYATS